MLSLDSPSFSAVKTLGVISDTHGLLRPEATRAIRKVDLILHAGDVGSEDVLRQLLDIAPVAAIRGNVDRGSWAAQLPPSLRVDVNGTRFFLVHSLSDLAEFPAPADTRVVISGHSHQPNEFGRDGVTYLNPGSAGPRRFSLPVSLVLARPETQGWRFVLHHLVE